MPILFQNRIQVGEELASKLKSYLHQSENVDYKELENVQVKGSLIVLAIPRGGVVLGNIIASQLHCNLYIVVSRKIGAPSNKELAIGAVLPAGSYFINEHLVDILDMSEKYIQRKQKFKRMK